MPHDFDEAHHRQLARRRARPRDRRRACAAPPMPANCGMREALAQRGDQAGAEQVAGGFAGDERDSGIGTGFGIGMAAARGDSASAAECARARIAARAFHRIPNPDPESRPSSHQRPLAALDEVQHAAHVLAVAACSRASRALRPAAGRRRTACGRRA